MLLLLLLYLPFFLFIFTIFPTPICHIFLLENFPVIHPRHDKLIVVYLLFSKFNSSQIPEFDNSWKLMTTRIFFLTSLGIVPDEKPFTSFLSFSCFTIVPDNSNTSILIPLASPYMSLFFLTIGDLSFLILISQMLVW